MLRSPVTKWIVIAAWLLLVLGSAGFAMKLTEAQDNGVESWLPPDAESTRILDELAGFMPADALTTVVAYEKRSGLTEADIAAIHEQAVEMQSLDGVRGEVMEPVVAPDGEAAQVSVTFDFGSDALERMPEAAADLEEIAELPGADVYVTGAGGQFADEVNVFATLDSTLTFTALGVVILILLLAYRSPVLWIFPIVSVVSGLLVTQALVYALITQFGLVVNAQSTGLLNILVIGVGTDYAMLLVARYREELHRHEDRHAAMAAALPRVLPALLASAGTVAAALVCLAVADVGATAGMGPVGAIGIGMTFVAMVTLMPALLLTGGRWIFWPRRPRNAEAEHASAWHWIGTRIARGPRLIWIATAVVLAIGALGVLRLDTGGLASDEQYTTSVDSVTGLRALERHGLADGSQPLLVVTDSDRVGEVTAGVASVDGAGAVTPVGTADGRTLLRAELGLDPLSEEAYVVVRDVRDATGEVPDTLVGGAAAQNLDGAEAASRDNRVVIPLVLIVVFLILLALLRAVVAPVLLMLTVVLSFGTALGVSTLLFEALGFAGADPTLPLYAFVFLVALGVDYNIFLVTRIREETTAFGTRAAARRALAATGGVITAAGLVLAATFSVLATLPLVGIAEIGLTVALGILIDTLIVRSVLVTGLALDLGERFWWPARLRSNADLGGAEETTAGGRPTETGPDVEGPVAAQAKGASIESDPHSGTA